ncbi:MULTISPECIES: MarR family winged helix-turn-helix transcriptional regulator [unclassified Gordonia (in: high G+C Gram-positive bacteria)]|uniref:MarR family winged helix-turn-helix transcriptional regulator n=1 Tax=unclassified Gordonia (in: high G+C Gram-positive bacteria) TaxID=2657482 RepID=UPI0007E95781|nr:MULTISPECIES: MarR family winged helix-turn-helix transcriptional regulator [unclassified Gordonia (in: high G+C Gram-positive bacteria)]OBC06543.1 MarR family transcriptional regulator [Gordonia sp. 852002-50395_SCH5434458]OBC11694.1 MarR family transcriptional regulator [Gordonia sp. 852002-50816_SCH5313054-a]OBC16725.1 MarR family transcriptional regulator [Gordonia sp. 852002-50816_SCH5313054-c]
MTRERVSGADDSSDDYAPWPSPLYRDLAEEFLRMTRRRSHVDPDSILEVSAFNLLWILSDGKPRTLRQLTDAMQLEQSTVNRQVNAAIKHGHLERFDVAGSISKQVRPTRAGLDAFEHDGLLRARRLERVLSDMGPGSPEALFRQLHAFNNAYDRTLADDDRDRRRHG